jgi:predicted RNase H-like HicB family nuclease
MTTRYYAAIRREPDGPVADSTQATNSIEECRALAMDALTLYSGSPIAEIRDDASNKLIEVMR